MYDADRIAALERADKQVIWHGFCQMAEYEPLVIERAEGNYLYDVRGRKLLDGVSSLWCNVHGHNHPRLNAAIEAQLQRVAHVPNLGLGNVPVCDLATRLVELAPEGIEHAFFSCDGSSSVEAALKLAFQYWQQRDDPRPEKVRFAALGSAYHGDTTGSVALGGVEHFHRLFAPILFDAVRLPTPDRYRPPESLAEYADDETQLCAAYLQRCREILEPQASEIAALIVEPIVQGAAGMIVQPRGFLRGLRELTRELDILLICDEVATGFGRTGHLFACEREGVAPDLLCLGKGITGGYLPMAVTMASDTLWQAFLAPTQASQQFFHGHTYGGNPLAAAAALASLDLFEENDVVAQVQRKALYLAERLARLTSHRFVGDVRQVGLMVGIELVECRETKRPFDRAALHGARICQRAIERGVWLRPLGDVIVLMPPLSIEEAELDLLVDAVEHALEHEFTDAAV